MPRMDHDTAQPSDPTGTTARPNRSGSQIDHLNLAVPDLEAAVAFYEPVLASIDVGVVLRIPAEGERPAMTGFGWVDRKPFFWLLDGGTVGSNMHLAFTVPDRAGVHAFHEAALAQGAEELHAPAVHTEYHDDYYGGFVLDPHGINIEAVCHHPSA